jgi:hypothetical protein
LAVALWENSKPPDGLLTAKQLAEAVREALPSQKIMPRNRTKLRSEPSHAFFKALAE